MDVPGVSSVNDALWDPWISQSHLSPHPRTALMLGCEYGCKDAVEVLLRNGADVGLTDGLGHDCAYYARIGDNIDILALIKAAVEDSSRGRRNLQHFSLGGIVSLLLCLQELFWRWSFDHKGHKLPGWEGKDRFWGCLVLVKLLRGILALMPRGLNSIDYGSYSPLFYRNSLYFVEINSLYFIEIAFFFVVIAFIS